MMRLIIVRLIVAVPTLLFVFLISFVLMRIAPGGPFDLERPLDPTTLNTLRRVYDLDAPLWEQFFTTLSALAHGDLGPSLAWRDFTVLELFRQALPVSATLGVAALGIALSLGALLGMIAAAKAGTSLDRIVVSAGSLGVLTPSFVLAPVMQMIFGLWLKWLPVGGMGSVSHYVMPIAVLAAPQVAAVARLTRATALDALQAPPQRTALAYGLPVSVRLGRAFRAALLPLISYLGPAAASVLTGSVVVETLFGLPGVGRYFVQAALDRDYTVSLGAALLAAGAIITFNLFADIMYIVVDPRVRA